MHVFADEGLICHNRGMTQWEKTPPAAGSDAS